MQHLQLGQEVNAKFSWKPLTNNGVTFINNGATHDSGYTPQNFKMIVNNSISGNVVQITYDNLQHSSYGDQKITKIIAIVHDVVKKAQTGNVDFWNNPFNGFWYEEISDITIDYHFYLANGKEVNFDPKLSDAWITAGSLNSGGGRTEAVKLESAGKAYGFYKSSVTAHNGNELYADGSNERNTTESAFGKGIIVPIPQGEWWDNPATGLRSKNAYYGAGVFKVEGKGVSLHYKVYGKPNQWESIWANLDTTMPKSNSGIVTPTIHYHHTNVALGLEINLIS